MLIKRAPVLSHVAKAGAISRIKKATQTRRRPGDERRAAQTGEELRKPKERRQDKRKTWLLSKPSYSQRNSLLLNTPEEPTATRGHMI
jgi:hypothetical protein